MDEYTVFYKNGVPFARFSDGSEFALSEVTGETYETNVNPDTGAYDAPATPPPAEGPMASHPTKARPYQFGDIGGQAGNESLGTAWDVATHAGYVTPQMLPEWLAPYVSPASAYLPDMALAGITGLLGLMEKGIGYGSEVVGGAGDAVASSLGISPRWGPGGSAAHLSNDMMSMLDVSGAAPEERIAGMLSHRAGLLSPKTRLR